MREMQIFLALLFAVSATNAQISITSKNMPKAGDTARVSLALPTSLPTGWRSAGANKTWDFSKLNPTGTQLREFKASFRTPYAFYFFNQVGEKIADTLGGGPLTFTNVHNFYSTTNSVYKAEGLGYSVTGIPLAANYTDDDEIYQFPLEYNDSDVSTFRFKFEVPGQQLITYIQQGTRTNVVDAYGSIKTPFKTYSDVIRVKTIMNQVDTLVSPIGKTGIPRPQVIYKWLAQGEVVPVLEIRGTQALGGTFTPTEVFFRDSLKGTPDGGGNQNAFVNRMEKEESSCLRVFPVPSNDQLNIHFTCPTLVAINWPSNIKVYNAMGVAFEIPQVRASDDHWYYSIKELPAGLYQVQFMGMGVHFVKM
jgi:hypothetical protein